MFAFDLRLQFLLSIAAVIAAVAFALAVPVEYLCHRRGWGRGVRLLGWGVGIWAAGVVLLALAFDGAFEKACMGLMPPSAAACHPAELVRHYPSFVPFLVWMLLALWSILYPAAAAICRITYRRALARPGASL